MVCLIALMVATIFYGGPDASGDIKDSGIQQEYGLILCPNDSLLKINGIGLK